MNSAAKLLGVMMETFLSKNTDTFLPLPFNYTISVTDRCNSRCKTCNMWVRQRSPNQKELTADEYTQLFSAIGDSPYWVTFSGGEPTLRTDFYDILYRLCVTCHPAVVNIPTNSLNGDALYKILHRIVHVGFKDITFKVNLSLDGIDEGHDNVRGVKGNYDKVISLFNQLSALAFEEETEGQLNVGLYTILSKYNLDQIPQLAEFIRRVHPRGYGIEIAQNRVELGNESLDVTPSVPEIRAALTKMLSILTRDRTPLPDWYKVRKEYYKFALKTLTNKHQALPCYAGYAFCQISPYGDVWACCVKAQPMGNIRDYNFDFNKLWHSAKANYIRHNYHQNCYCVMANAFTTSALFDPPTILRRLPYISDYKGGKI